MIKVLHTGRLRRKPAVSMQSEDRKKTFGEIKDWDNFKTVKPSTWNFLEFHPKKGYFKNLIHSFILIINNLYLL
jgi:hypothetical protein